MKCPVSGRNMPHFGKQKRPKSMAKVFILVYQIDIQHVSHCSSKLVFLRSTFRFIGKTRVLNVQKRIFIHNQRMNMQNEYEPNLHLGGRAIRASLRRWLHLG